MSIHTELFLVLMLTNSLRNISNVECMQAAVKLARHATKKQTVIVCRGGYHGRTMGTMAMTTSKTIYR
jgi:4-aminobutyrate aminotransferase